MRAVLLDLKANRYHACSDEKCYSIYVSSQDMEAIPTFPEPPWAERSWYLITQAVTGVILIKLFDGGKAGISLVTVLQFSLHNKIRSAELM